MLGGGLAGFFSGFFRGFFSGFLVGFFKGFSGYFRVFLGEVSSVVFPPSNCQCFRLSLVFVKYFSGFSASFLSRSRSRPHFLGACSKFRLPLHTRCSPLHSRWGLVLSIACATMWSCE